MRFKIINILILGEFKKDFIANLPLVIYNIIL